MVAYACAKLADAIVDSILCVYYLTLDKNINN